VVQYGSEPAASEPAANANDEAVVSIKEEQVDRPPIESNHHDQCISTYATNTI
jgi:hypothetical protein